jgi:hypothetical protein
MTQYSRRAMAAYVAGGDGFVTRQQFPTATASTCRASRQPDDHGSAAASFTCSSMLSRLGRAAVSRRNTAHHTNPDNFDVRSLDPVSINLIKT